MDTKAIVYKTRLQDMRGDRAALLAQLVQDVSDVFMRDESGEQPEPSDRTPAPSRSAQEISSEAKAIAQEIFQQSLKPKDAPIERNVMSSTAPPAPPKFLGLSVDQIEKEVGNRELAELHRHDGSQARWNADGALRNEFNGDFNAYTAYSRALRSNGVMGIR